MSGHKPWSEIKFKKDDGEAAIRRERKVIAEEELEKYGLPPSGTPLFPVIEGTDAAQAAFKAKLAYWREHGAPAYHGPKAAQ